MKTDSIVQTVYFTITTYNIREEFQLLLEKKYLYFLAQIREGFHNVMV